ncbi:MAG: HhH-GPD [Micavibrio sp.]|nr:HhH-GPD [Micavibrio sp.]
MPEGEVIEYLHQHPAIYEGLNHLLTKDPVFKKLKKRPEDFLRSYSGPGFSELVRIVIGQQVSMSAARSVWQRMEDHFKIVEPRKILKMEEDALRAFGLSGQKAKYIRGLSEAVHGKAFDPHALEEMDDADIYAAITALKGFGPWSAEMYMMFSLARPDVWPVGDLGVREGLRLYLKRTDRLTQEETLMLGQRFAPYRTAASILLWHLKAQDDLAQKTKTMNKKKAGKK